MGSLMRVVFHWHTVPHMHYRWQQCVGMVIVLIIDIWCFSVYSILLDSTALNGVFWISATGYEMLLSMKAIWK